MDDEEDGEPTGSCDECGCNIYDHETFHSDGETLCDQCAWYISQVNEPDHA